MSWQTGRQRFERSTEVLHVREHELYVVRGSEHNTRAAAECFLCTDSGLKRKLSRSHTSTTFKRLLPATRTCPDPYCLTHTRAPHPNSVPSPCAAGGNPPISTQTGNHIPRRKKTAKSNNKQFYLVTPPAQKIVRLWVLWFQFNRFINVFLRKTITNTHYVFVTSKYNVYKSR